MKWTFQYNPAIGEEDVDELMTDYPDLQIKTWMSATDINHPNAPSVDLCVGITILFTEAIPVLPILPNVTVVALLNYSKCDFRNSLRSFPNLRELRVQNSYDGADRENLNDLHLYLSDKVKSVTIDLCRKNDLTVIRSLIDNRPLVEISVTQVQINEIPIESFMEMLINSRNVTLKTVNFSFIMKIKGSKIECKFHRNSFNLLPQLLNRFTKVTHIELTIERSNLGNWSQVAQEIMAADHRRSINLTITGDENIRY